MYKTILYKELRENIRNYRFIIAFILCVTIIPLSFFVDWRGLEEKSKLSTNLFEFMKKVIGLILM